MAKRVNLVQITCGRDIKTIIDEHGVPNKVIAKEMGRAVTDVSRLLSTNNELQLSHAFMIGRALDRCEERGIANS